MHPAAKFQFERTAREFSQWRAVPEEDRSPAPAWWWQPAIEVVAQHEEMAALLYYRLQLPVGSTYAAGAAVLMATLADQTSLRWPDEFPRDPPAIGVIRALNRNVEWNSITIAAEAEAGPIALGPCVRTATTRLFF
jgi:hypothetical protein